MNKIRILSILTLALSACNSEMGQEDSAPDSMVDTSGKVWTKGSEAKFTTYPEMVERQREGLFPKLRDKYENQEIDLEVFNRSVDAISYGSFPIDESAEESQSVLTAEQLSENLRGVTLINGHEYIGELDLVESEGVSFKNLTKASSPSSSSAVTLSPAEDKTKCCGNDDRFQSTSTSDYAAILLSEIGCTVGLISNNVGVTAAHCIYDTEDNSWMQVRHTSTTWSMPYYRRETSYNDTTPQLLTCYRVTVPSCWVSATSNSSVTCDYAVIDFSTNGTTACSDTTPFGTWNGSWIRTDAQIEEASTWGMGYPALVNLSDGNINGPGLTLVYDSLNSTWGSGTFIDGKPLFAPPYGVSTNNATGVEIRNLVDASEGDSGRPHLDYISTGNYMIGHHIGNVASGSYNIDRRFDSTVWSFIQAYSPL